jgi:hypothetical protein
MLRGCGVAMTEGRSAFFPYCLEEMRAMVPAIYASTVNPIQNNAMMENGIMAFTVTFLLAV